MKWKLHKTTDEKFVTFVTYDDGATLRLKDCKKIERRLLNKQKNMLIAREKAAGDLQIRTEDEIVVIIEGVLGHVPCAFTAYAILTRSVTVTARKPNDLIDFFLEHHLIYKFSNGVATTQMQVTLVP
uniref:Uncharacterized protein n=1 Tax=Glossina austeni TaxID=7395 RepID=A0A1A9VY08_GLOAU